MSASAGDVPCHIGPFTVIAPLDGDVPDIPVPERRFLARSADGAQTVLLGAPLAGADPVRFAAEAEASRYLLGPWSSPATQLAPPSGEPWHARPYLPVLPLPTALAVHGGPLPEHTVRALGAALAETLSVVHGQALTHAGVSPAAVLLAAEGPRLGCYGAVRAAAADGGGPRSGLPGIESGSLPPEQAAGEQPGPAGDIYALGAVLAYAATGHTVPERDELPPSLRPVLTACRSRVPSDRPHAAQLLEEFSGADRAPDRTPGDGARASALLGPGWLPGRLIAALAHQSSLLLAAETAPAAPSGGSSGEHPAAPDRPPPYPPPSYPPPPIPHRQD